MTPRHLGLGGSEILSAKTLIRRIFFCSLLSLSLSLLSSRQTSGGPDLRRVFHLPCLPFPPHFSLPRSSSSFRSGDGLLRREPPQIRRRRQGISPFVAPPPRLAPVTDLSDVDSDGQAPPTKAPRQDSDDSDYIVACELSKNRRVTVRNWNGKVVVDIREFYVKDGKTLPGKKGIAFPMDQWNKLVKYMPEIEKALADT